MFYTTSMDTRKVRKRVLPPGWYPADEKETISVLKKWEDSLSEPDAQLGIAAIVPHAGWSFSGKLAYKTMRLLNPDSKVVVVIGGHMRPGDGIALAEESYFETPFGPVPAADEFKDLLIEQTDVKIDRNPDNTVEVQLPIVRYLFPDAEIAWLRVGSGREAMQLGRICAGIAATLHKPLSVIGSTDLTHYGPNYGFAPKGIGPEAVKWAQQENDAGIIQQMLEMKPREVLSWGNRQKAACSAGAAAAVIEYAAHMGCEEGVLVGYDSSYSVHPDSSFVGYAGVIYHSTDK